MGNWNVLDLSTFNLKTLDRKSHYNTQRPWPAHKERMSQNEHLQLCSRMWKSQFVQFFQQTFSSDSFSLSFNRSMDVRGSLNIEDNLVYVTGQGAESSIENDSFFAKVPPQAASTVGRSKSRQYLVEDEETGSFLDTLPRNKVTSSTLGDLKFQLDDSLATANQQVVSGYEAPSGGSGGGVGKAGDEWSVVNAWCRENIHKNDFDTDGKSSLGILNVDDMDLSSNNLLTDTPLEELLRGRGGPETATNFPRELTSSKPSVLKDSASPRLLDGSSGTQDSKELLTADSNTWQQEGSSNSQDSKQDHPFARSKLGTVKKASSEGVAKSSAADSLTAAIKQSLFGQMPIGEVPEEADTSVHEVELGHEDLHELDQDFGDMECSIGDDSDQEDREGSKTPTNKDYMMAGAKSKIDSIFLRHGLTTSYDGEDRNSKKLTYLSKVALFDENGNDFNSGSEIDTEDELEMARKGMRHEAAGEDSSEESTRPGLEGGCSDSGERQLPITQRQSAEGIVVSPIPGDGGGGGDGSSGSESDDGGRSGVNINQQSSAHVIQTASQGNVHYSLSSGNQEQRIRPMGDDLLSEMRQSTYASSSTTLDKEDTRLQSIYLRAISPNDDPTADNFRVEDFLSSPDPSIQQDFGPGDRLEASGFNADDAKENSNPFGVMESSFGSFGLSGTPSGDNQNLPAGFGMPSNLESSSDTRLRLSGGQNVTDGAWERMIGSNRTSVASRSSSFGTQQNKSPKQGPSPAHSTHSLTKSQENIPNMFGRGSKDSSLGERTAASGSLGRSSGGNMAVARSTSPVSGYSSEGSDPGFSVSYDKIPQDEPTPFKVPTMPAPKSGIRTTAARPKTTGVSSKRASSGTASLKSSTGSTTQLDGMVGNDLAYRMSLTGKAEEQTEGLKRVPSIGGTSELDLTIPDTEFFGNDAGLQMLEEDEKQFEEDNVFRQDDAMVDTGSPNDSWAFQNFTSVARPSWMEPGDNEETLNVRISVGTFIRGRTEALGTLEGDCNVPRPDFGMSIQSPPKVSARPVGLIDIEESRTSGVGETSNDMLEQNPGEEGADTTLTVEALSGSQTAEESSFDLAGLGISTINKTMKPDTSALTMDDVSMFFKTNKDPTKIVEGLTKLRDSKHRPRPDQPPVSKSAGSNPQQLSTAKAPVSPPKASHLPVRKGSNISRSFHHRDDMSHSFDGRNEAGNPRSDSFAKGNLMVDSSKAPDKKFEYDKEKTLTTQEQMIHTTKDNPFEELKSADLWTSPPRASIGPRPNGLLEKLQEFSFKFDSTQKDIEKSNITRDLRETFSEENHDLMSSQASALPKGSAGITDDIRSKGTDNQTGEVCVGERETPPPDGQSYNGANSTQNVQISSLAKGRFSVMSDSSARPIYDSGFNSVTDSQFRDSSLSSQRDPFKSELESAIRSRFYSNADPDTQGISQRDKELDISLVPHNLPKSSSSGTGSHTGFVPGHHVPDGTEYSHQSDYSHMDHKGMSRDDLEGTADIGLADSRGFDAIRGTKSQISAQEMERSLRSQIRYERDKEHRLDKVVLGEGNVSDRITSSSIHSGSQISKSKPPVSLQPSQSLSPLIKSSRSHAAKQTGFGDQGTEVADEHKTVETQTAADKHESWTQTSVILRESIGLQPDDIENNHAHTDDHSLKLGKNIHSLVQDKHTVVSSSVKDTKTPHLLSKDSLLNTEFAQEYLKRDFSMEVMDRIYSSSENTRQQQHNTDSTVHHLNSRESVDSRTDWTTLKPNETMDSTYQDASRIDITQRGFDPTYPSFYHRPPTACSTPFVGGRDMQTTLTPSSMHTLPSTGYRSMVASDGAHLRSTDRGSLCPVKAPGILKFTEACVVGISKTEILPLTNPTDRWLECILKVKSVEIDGRKAALEIFPFEMRQKKIIIDPHKTEKVEVLFLPNRPGAFVAEVCVFSQSFLRSEKDTVDSIPVCVTFQAIAEKPKILVSFDDDELSKEISFGELSWGMCKEKTVCLKNQGLATVPLRLAIVSEGAWHCFSFEPDGRNSDVSVISGQHVPVQTKNVMNLCLPGSNTPFNYHEIKVWCRPPDKYCDRAMARLPPEHFSCRIDIELDIPYSKVPVCKSLCLRAVVGVHKLHMQSNIRELQLSACPGKTRETGFKIYNAGNLELNLSFWFVSHSGVFTVKPETIQALQPSEEAMLSVKFTPRETVEQRLSSLLLMMVQPQGPMFEVQVQGDVVPRRKDLDVMCDCTDLDFGGVVLGQTCLKQFRLINRDTLDVTLTLRARVDNFELYKSSDISKRGASVLDIVLKPEVIVPVYVLFSPTTTKPVRGKIVMKSEQSDRKYTVHVSGYGGVSKLCCSERSVEKVSAKGHPCILVRNLSTERVKHFYVHNRGSRSAVVKVSTFTDVSCTSALSAGQVIVQPSDFVIESQGTQKIEVVISLSEREFVDRTREHDVGAALRFNCQDKIDWPKPHKSQLIIGLVGSVKKHDSRVSGGSLSLTAGSINTTSGLENMTAHSTQMSSLSRTVSHMTQRSEKTMVGSVEEAEEEWVLTPQDLILYCPTGNKDAEREKFHIVNRSNRDISFLLSWPADMISLKPGKGTIKSREKQEILISASKEVKDCMDQLPWSGEVTVRCEKNIKILKVEIRRETVLPVERIPVTDDHSLVPVGASHQAQSLAGSNKVGNLEISRTTIQFGATRVGKASEEILELNNVGKDMIRWMFSSFAAPYLRKKADNSKELFRVSYKVFDFSHQFGKLNGYSNMQLVLKFMPRSSGTFSQYWDVQTTGNAVTTPQKEGCIRVHLTGEGIEQEEATSGPTVTVEELMPRPKSDHHRLKLTTEVLKFPCASPGSSTILKVDLKNGYLDDVKIEVTEPKPPFYIRHHSIKVDKKRYLRFPVEFEPTRGGSYSDVVKFQSSKGENLILKVEGQCK